MGGRCFVLYDGMVKGIGKKTFPKDVGQAGRPALHNQQPFSVSIDSQTSITQTDGRLTDRQIDRRTDTQTGTQTDTQARKHAGRQAERQTVDQPTHVPEDPPKPPTTPHTHASCTPAHP